MQRCAAAVCTPGNVSFFDQPFEDEVDIELLPLLSLFETQH